MNLPLKESEIQKNAEYLEKEINGMYLQGDIATRMVYNLFSLGLGSSAHNFSKADSDAKRYAYILSEHMSADIAQDKDYRNIPLGYLKIYINSHKLGKPELILNDIKTKAEVIKDLHDYLTVSRGLSESLPLYTDKMNLICERTDNIFSKKLAFEFLQVEETMTMFDLIEEFKFIDEDAVSKLSCERTLSELVILGKELNKLH